MKSRKFLVRLINFITFVLSALAGITSNIILVLLVLTLIFLNIYIDPQKRKRENIYMFCFAFVYLLPINIGFIYKILNLFDYHIILDLLYGITMYIILFCIEEITLGLATRYLWRHQMTIKVIDS